MAVELRDESTATVDADALTAVARFVLDSLGVHPQAELSIYVVDEPAIAKLHEHYMGLPGPTDVLAFAMDELSSGRAGDEDDPLPMLLGDVVLCPEVARRQAESAGHSQLDELALLCTHGVLHLLGYNHEEPEEEQEMFDLQAELLASWRARSA
ncbi:MAG: rRNA maturation RNase YbeY [Mycobacteriales bacterium]